MFMCPANSYFLTMAYHFWHIGLSPREVDTYIHVPDSMLTFDLKVRFIGFCLHVRSVTSVSFDICIPYLAHGSFTMRGCVKYSHDLDTTLTFDLKVRFFRFITLLCVQASAFLSFDIVILCLARECIIMVRCVALIHELCMTLPFDLNIKMCIFTMDLSLARCLCSLA